MSRIHRLRSFLALVAIVSAILLFPASAELRIHEFMPSGEGSPLTDEDGDRSDWIELLNLGEVPLAVGGYALTDRAADPQRWTFPDVSVAPGAYLIVFASGKDRTESEEPFHTNFKLDREGEYLALTNPQGEIVQLFDPAYVEVPSGLSYGLVPGSESQFEFLTPTPGEPNATPGPLIEVVDHTPKPANADEDLIVTASVRATASPIESVQLSSTTMFRPMATAEMRDDGVAPDAAAGDGVFSGRIAHRSLFGPLFQPGSMVRWYIEATDQENRTSRWPAYAEAESTESFTGTVIHDPDIDTNLAVFHHFLEHPADAETDRGMRGAVYYAGEFYDNVFFRLRGGTARSWPKKSFKVEFPEDHHFRFDPELPRVDEFNLNATYTDKSYARAILTTEIHQASGTPSPITFPMRVQQNGEFYSVALFVEQPDRDFLRRNGMDPDGAYYKANPGSTYAGGTGSFEKKTRREESKADLEVFLAGLRLDGKDLEAFILDHVDIPAMINFLAGIVITQNIDNSDKNHYLYRDTNGTRHWEMIPWDLDLTFGPDALNTDYIIADENSQGATYPNASHPFIGTHEFPLHAGKTNELIDAVLTTGRTRAMFLRRVRSLHDAYLATTYFDDRLDELVVALKKDVLLDREAWGGQVHFPGRRDTMEATVERIKTEYLERRRSYIERGAEVGIPPSQPDNPMIRLAGIDFSPTSGNQDEEYVALENGSPFAVDMSGWRIEGGIRFTFQPGTVLPPGSLFNPGVNALYLAKNIADFRGRAEGPAGGQGLFVQGTYDGNLSNAGESFRLMDDQDREVAVFAYEGNPSAVERDLRISEILAEPLSDPDAEFIELWNRGTETLDLAGLRFTEGIVFDFDDASIWTLEPNGRLLVVKSRASFEAVYGSGLAIAGEFAEDTRLDNAGEILALDDADNNTIQKVDFGDSESWPTEVGGTGRSWVLLNPDAPEDGKSWAASKEVGGSPGVSESDGFSGGPEADADRDGYSAWLEHVLGSSDSDPGSLPRIRIESADGAVTLTFSRRPSADDVEIDVEESTTLNEWVPSPDWEALPAAAGEVRLRRMALTGAVFLRLRIQAPPLGEDS